MKMFAQVIGLLVLSIVLQACAHGHHHGHKHGHKHGPMKMLDADKSGAVSKAEWDAHFAEMDKNSDGQVDGDEMRAHHKEMRGKHKSHGDRGCKCSDGKECKCEGSSCKCGKDKKGESCSCCGGCEGGCDGDKCKCGDDCDSDKCRHKNKEKTA